MTHPKLDLRSFASLARAAKNVAAWRGKRIGAELREQIILHVSATNSCPVCSAAHQLVARAVGLDDEDVREARAPEPPPDLDERTRVALRYADARTRGEDDPDLVARFEQLFDPEEQREVRAIVDLFTFANRFNNTWEAPLPGAAWRRRKLGIPE